MMGISTETLTGPIGGIIAIAYGAGAASGYAFCLRTMYKILKEQGEKDESSWKKRVEDLEEEVRDAKAEIKLLQDRQYRGMERQDAQQRDSALYLMDRGEIRPIKTGRKEDNE